MTLKLREDEEACAKVVPSGYSRKLRHLKCTHEVSLAAAKGQLDRDDTARGGQHSQAESRCVYKGVADVEMASSYICLLYGSHSMITRS